MTQWSPETGQYAVPTLPITMQPSDVIWTYDNRDMGIAAAAVIGAANRAVTARVIAPKSGFLRDFVIGVASASGNVDVGVYDTGDTASTVRTKLASSGSISCPAALSAAANPVAWDPGAGALSVIAGRHYEFALACDNNTATFYRKPVQGGQLPAAYMPVPGAALPKLCTVIATSFPLPTTFAEASLTQNSYLVYISARISAT